MIAFAAFKIADIVSGLALMAGGLIRSTLGLAEETAALTDPAADPAQRKSLDELNDKLENQIKALQEAQARADEEIEKKREEADKKATREKIAALKDQEQLLEAQGKKRLAEIEASGRSEKLIAEERKQLEDDLAKKRLEVENRIGELEEESAAARGARLASYEADQINRDAKSRPHEDTHAAERDAFDRAAGGRGRIDARARIEMGLSGNIIARDGVAEHGRDSMGRPLDPMSSMLSPDQEARNRSMTADRRRQDAAQTNLMAMHDRYNQTLPLPSPASNPASDTASGSQGGGPGGPGGQGGGSSDPAKSMESMERTLTEQMKRLTAAIDQAKTTAGRSGDRAVGLLEDLNRQLERLQSRLDKIQRA